MATVTHSQTGKVNSVHTRKNMLDEMTQHVSYEDAVILAAEICNYRNIARALAGSRKCGFAQMLDRELLRSLQRQGQ